MKMRGETETRYIFRTCCIELCERKSFNKQKKTMLKENETDFEDRQKHLRI